MEVGAGSGLWSRVLSHHVDVVATDAAAGENSYRQAVGVWHPVAQAGAVDAIRANPGRSVLMVWPSYDEPWSGLAADAMRAGTVLCYIGEGPCGCTGDERFHSLLEDRFERLRDVSLPQFDGIHDHLQIFQKGLGMTDHLPPVPPALQKYVDYIRNTGQQPLPVAAFDDDWDPVGPMVRERLKAGGWIFYGGPDLPFPTAEGIFLRPDLWG